MGDDLHPSGRVFDPAGIVRELSYVTIGFGVLGIQRAQVRRRETIAAARTHPALQRVGITAQQVDAVMHRLESSMVHMDERAEAVESVLDGLVDHVAPRLPPGPAVALQRGHRLGRVARAQIRGVIRNSF